ncbi:MAG: preprotein translocase subunit YajC [Gammaproteobacteria bacterium RBG_16_51_14]|nr:MAG: preprotein translocase subunit YajC [Gammaproteobacteria bacterium RBG_16_51_14]
MFEFFINNAWAQETPSQGGGLFSLLPLIVLFAVFYFFLIRPQMKQAKEHRQLVEGLSKGDEVITNGGLLGKIKQIGDNFIVLEIASDTEVKVQRQSISAIMPKGTLKTL